LQERDSGGFLRDLDLTGSSVKLGIGGIDADPTDGQFKLVLNSVTSNAISFNATPAQVYTAISGIAGTGVGVATTTKNYSPILSHQQQQILLCRSVAMPFRFSRLALFL